MRKNDHDAGKTRERDCDLRRGAQGFSRFNELSLEHSAANCGGIILQIMLRLQPTKGITNYGNLCLSDSVYRPRYSQR
jgi:hypothetical protein